MTEAQNGMRKAEERQMLPAIDLFPQVEYNGRKLDAAVFGSNTYDRNLAEMQKGYFHSKDLPSVTFRELTTAESISVAAYDFENLAKLQIFNPSWLQAGRILRTREGVWANLPRNEKKELITAENALRTYLNGIKPIKVGKGNIYLSNNDLGFAEYETFERGVQDCDTFAQGGLARILEHTPEMAVNLRTIASPKFYKKGVNVWAFEPTNEPSLRVVRLDSNRNIASDRLDVEGSYWNDINDGYAFGGLVSDSGEASAKDLLLSAWVH